MSDRDRGVGGAQALRPAREAKARGGPAALRTATAPVRCPRRTGPCVCAALIGNNRYVASPGDPATIGQGCAAPHAERRAASILAPDLPKPAPEPTVRAA